MAYGVNVLTGQVHSIASALTTAALDVATNAVITSGYNVLTGQIKPVGSAVTTTALDLATNVVLT